VAFLAELLGDADVAAGVLDTGLIDRRTAERAAPATPRLAAVAAALARLESDRGTGPWGDRRGWRLCEPVTVSVRLVDGRGEPVEVHLRDTGDGAWDASVDDASWHVAAALDGSRLHLTVDGEVHGYSVAIAGAAVWVGHRGAAWSFTPVVDDGAGGAAGAAGGLTVASPMPGTVVGVDVAVGDRVSAGQPVAVVEAMKMEHTLRAAHDAVVREVAVAAGDKVALHQTLVVIEVVDE